MAKRTTTWTRSWFPSRARARDEEATADATKRVAEKEAELARLDRLLRLADPPPRVRSRSDMQRSRAPGGGGARASPRTSRARGAGSRPRRRLRRRAAAEAERARPRRVGKARRAHRQARVCRERSERSERRWRRRRRRRAGIGRPGERGGECGAPRRRVHRTGEENAFEKAAAGGGVGGSGEPFGSGRRGVSTAFLRRPPGFFKDDVGSSRPSSSARHLGGSGGSAGLEIRAPKRRKGDNAARGSVAAAAEARVADDVRRLLGGGGGFDAGDGDGDGGRGRRHGVHGASGPVGGWAHELERQARVLSHGERTTS